MATPLFVSNATRGVRCVAVVALKIHLSASAHDALAAFPGFVTERRGSVAVKVARYYIVCAELNGVAMRPLSPRLGTRHAWQRAFSEINTQSDSTGGTGGEVAVYDCLVCRIRHKKKEGTYALSLSFHHATKHYKIDQRKTRDGMLFAIERGPPFDNLMDVRRSD